MSSSPEVRAEGIQDTGDEELVAPVCLLRCIQEAREANRPLPEGAGQVIKRASSSNHPNVDVTLRRCAPCAVEIELGEFVNAAPTIAAPNGELAFLPSCTEL